jgi:hypothetical protein
MQLIGNYYFDLKFGGVPVPVSPQMMEECSITMDVDRLLPTFKLVIKDATGLLGDIIPYDGKLNSVELGFTRLNGGVPNTFKFSVKRRKPDSDKRYVIEGTLTVPSLMTALKTRALTGNVKDNIKTIANDELEISDTEFGTSLNYDKTIIQPRWTDAKLFGYLTQNLSGNNGEVCYYCFIKNVNGKQILVFKCLDELLSGPIQYKFIIAHKPYQDLIPITEYKIFDNSQLVVDFGAKSQIFGYFDYATGQYVEDSLDVADCPALSDYLLIDDDNTNDSMYLHGLGRNNSFTTDFHGAAGNFYRRINGLVNMWVSTWGLESVSPGDVVRVVYGEALARGKLLVYQHSGNWLVQRVVHMFGPTYMTNLLLTRCGIDTSLDTVLTPASNVKKK